MDLALKTFPGAIHVIGNAPDRPCSASWNILAPATRPPALVVGLPVGFVNAAESKQALLDSPVPYLTAVGRKGGSNVAASVINALAELARSA